MHLSMTLHISSRKQSQKDWSSTPVLNFENPNVQTSPTSTAHCLTKGSSALGSRAWSSTNTPLGDIAWPESGKFVVCREGSKSNAKEQCTTRARQDKGSWAANQNIGTLGKGGEWIWTHSRATAKQDTSTRKMNENDVAPQFDVHFCWCIHINLATLYAQNAKTNCRYPSHEDIKLSAQAHSHCHKV